MKAKDSIATHQPLASVGWLLAFLLTSCFTIATGLQLWFQNWSGNRLDADNFLDVLLGDSRRLFANHFFVEADVYLHAGYYPSIFDQAATNGKLKIASKEGPESEAEHAKEGHEHHDEHDDLPDFLNKPQNWIDKFGRNFYPTDHKHLSGKKDAAEILPWLMMSAKLDPKRVESITVTAYWLRKHVGRPDEAIQLLRSGLNANPDNPELLFELGLAYYDDKNDIGRARNLWEAALARWKEHAAHEENPDKLLFGRILSFLADLEEKDGRKAQALQYLEALLPYSPAAEMIQKRIEEMRQSVKQAPSPVAPAK